MNLQPRDKVSINPHLLQWLEDKEEASKLAQKLIGLFAVQKRVGKNTYHLDPLDTYMESNILNVQHLVPYRRSSEKFRERTELKEMRTKRPSSEEHQVEKVVAHRFNQKLDTIEFLI